MLELISVLRQYNLIDSLSLKKLICVVNLATSELLNVSVWSGLEFLLSIKITVK